MKRVVMFSSGIGSWYAARRVVDRHGTDGLVLLFADTLVEDADNYRFLEEAAKDVGGELIRIAEGRDPWTVFFDEKFLGNSRIDPCSKILKRRFMRNWMEKNCRPEETIAYIGIDWTEIHRYEKSKKYWEPWRVEAPLCERPFADKKQMIREAAVRGLKPPRMYAMGFSHANCQGACVKAGQGQWALLLKTMPDRYAYHESREQEFRAFIGKDVAILKETGADGKGKPLTLTALRERIENKGEVDLFDIGGCNCMSADGDDPSFEV